MIPMKCPKCSAKGEIPIDKLGMRLHCRKCGTHFYMDGAGHVYLGSPNDSGKTQKKVKESHPTEMIDLNPIRWFQELSRGSQIGVGIVAGVLVIGFALSSLLSPATPEGSVKKQADKVAELFIDRYPDKMKAYAVPESESSLMSWYNAARSQLALNQPRGSASDAVASTNVLNQSENTAETRTIVTMPDPSKPGHTAGYTLVWRHINGDWLIDFTASEAAFREAERVKAIEEQNAKSGNRYSSRAK